MPIRFSDLDLYALLDADSDDAKTFTTYLGYWLCLAEHVQTIHGDEPTASILADLRERKCFRSLTGRGSPRDPEQVRSLMLSGWTSELRLHLIDLEDAGRLWIGNHGAPIDAYYATSRMASAWLLIRDGAVPETHAGLLRAVSALVTSQKLFPKPWDLTCDALIPTPAYGGFPAPPEPCSNLSARVDVHDRSAMLLRTTRDRGVKAKVEEAKRKQKRSRARAGERQRQDERMAATTIFDFDFDFDFAWRMRTRSNYGDPGMFHVGTLTGDRSRAYAAAVRAWTTATMGLFEAVIAQRAGSLLEESAVYFLTRDRSGIADTLLLPRLKAIGLLST